MIIKASRISTKSGPSKLVRHVFYGPDNDDIRVLFGSEFDVSDAFLDAKRFAYSNAVRHVKISPAAVELDDDQAIQAAKAYAIEFGGDPDSIVLIRHEKARANDLAARTHFHVLIPEFNHTTGKVMDSSWMYPRHERLARQFEFEFRDTPVVGRFAKAVKKKLTQDGKTLANDIELPAELPKSAFTSDKHQSVKRTGHDLARMKAAVKKAWNPDLSVDEFQAYLADAGLRAFKGDKTWIIKTVGSDPIFIGTVERLAKVKRAEVDQFFAQPKYEAKASEPINMYSIDEMERKNDQKHNSRDYKQQRGSATSPTKVVETGGRRKSSDEDGPGDGSNFDSIAVNRQSLERDREEDKYEKVLALIRSVRSNLTVADNATIELSVRFGNSQLDALLASASEKPIIPVWEGGYIMSNIELNKRISKVYNDLDLKAERLRKTKNPDVARRLIAHLEEQEPLTRECIQRYVDFVLGPDISKLNAAEAEYKKLSVNMDDHLKLKPIAFFGLVKRLNGWQARKDNLERRIRSYANKCSRLSQELEAKREAVNDEKKLIQEKFDILFHKIKFIIWQVSERLSLNPSEDKAVMIRPMPGPARTIKPFSAEPASPAFRVG